MFTKALREYIEDRLGFGVVNIRQVSGGDINEAYAFDAGGAIYFIKIQDKPAGTDMFRAEQFGIHTIRETKTILTPDVVMTNHVREQSFLLMEYLEFCPATDANWIELGNQLAKLHKSESGDFGLTQDNFIGTLIQINTLTKKWSDFYTQYRIQPQINMASGLLPAADLKNWERLSKELESILTEEPPSLIHGDLWSGNVQMSDNGPIIYDPAICYANREMDLAMSLLFGGFPPLFYDAYEDEYPVMKSGFDDRMQIYQLYYLLVHVNLFGLSYVPAVSRILKKFA